MYALNYKDKVISYTVKRSKKAKRTSIKVSPKGVEIILPIRGNLLMAQNFLNKKSKWVFEAWQRISQNNTSEQMLRNILQRQDIFYRGIIYKFSIIRSTNSVMPELVIGDDIKIIVPLLWSESRYRSKILELLKKQFLIIITQDIKKYIDYYSVKFGLYPKDFKVKLHKSKWGSCSTYKNININLSLIFAPQAVLEYVVVHELCHLRYHNHSKKFWQLVASIIPDYKEKKLWLKHHHEIINYLDI